MDIDFVLLCSIFFYFVFIFFSFISFFFLETEKQTLWGEGKRREKTDIRIKIITSAPGIDRPA